MQNQNNKLILLEKAKTALTKDIEDVSLRVDQVYLTLKIFLLELLK